MINKQELKNKIRKIKKRGVTIVETVVALSIISIVTASAITISGFFRSFYEDNSSRYFARIVADNGLSAFQYAEDSEEFLEALGLANGIDISDVDVESLGDEVGYYDASHYGFDCILYDKENDTAELMADGGNKLLTLEHVSKSNIISWLEDSGYEQTETLTYTYTRPTAYSYTLIFTNEDTTDGTLTLVTTGKKATVIIKDGVFGEIVYVNGKFYSATSKRQVKIERSGKSSSILSGDYKWEWKEQGSTQTMPSNIENTYENKDKFIDEAFSDFEDEINRDNTYFAKSKVTGPTSTGEKYNCSSYLATIEANYDTNTFSAYGVTDIDERKEVFQCKYDGKSDFEDTLKGLNENSKKLQDCAGNTYTYLIGESTISSMDIDNKNKKISFSGNNYTLDNAEYENLMKEVSSSISTMKFTYKTGTFSTSSYDVTADYSKKQITYTSGSSSRKTTYYWTPEVRTKDRYGRETVTPAGFKTTQKTMTATEFQKAIEDFSKGEVNGVTGPNTTTCNFGNNGLKARTISTAPYTQNEDGKYEISTVFSVGTLLSVVTDKKTYNNYDSFHSAQVALNKDNSKYETEHKTFAFEAIRKLNRVKVTEDDKRIAFLDAYGDTMYYIDYESDEEFANDKNQFANIKYDGKNYYSECYLMEIDDIEREVITEKSGSTNWFIKYTDTDDVTHYYYYQKKSSYSSKYEYGWSTEQKSITNTNFNSALNKLKETYPDYAIGYKPLTPCLLQLEAVKEASDGGTFKAFINFYDTSINLNSDDEEVGFKIFSKRYTRSADYEEAKKGFDIKRISINKYVCTVDGYTVNITVWFDDRKFESTILDEDGKEIYKMNYAKG